jgi:hypothetical protein
MANSESVSLRYSILCSTLNNNKGATPAAHIKQNTPYFQHNVLLLQEIWCITHVCQLTDKILVFMLKTSEHVLLLLPHIIGALRVYSSSASTDVEDCREVTFFLFYLLSPANKTKRQYMLLRGAFEN